jgi:hypothetical protein
MKTNERRSSRLDEMRDHYDFAGGERGRYAKRINAAATFVVLAPDVARRFKTSEAVNEALRAYLKSVGRRGAGG